MDLMAALAHLNASGEAARMQVAIASHAHQLVYGIEHGHYRDDDAVGSTLRGMLDRVARRVRGAREEYSNYRQTDGW